MSASRASWRSRAETSIAGAGRRSGGARLAVVGLLAEHDCCLSAQEIADRLQARGQGVGIASIYRTIALLHEMGLVQRVETGDAGARYEAVVPGGEHHHHAVCESCGRVTAFEDPALERAIAQLERRLPHRVESHDVVLRGDCRRCAGGSASGARS